MPPNAKLQYGVYPALHHACAGLAWGESYPEILSALGWDGEGIAGIAESGVRWCRANDAKVGDYRKELNCPYASWWR